MQLMPRSPFLILFMQGKVLQAASFKQFTQSLVVVSNSDGNYSILNTVYNET
jgi:hypothetical protein